MQVVVDFGYRMSQMLYTMVAHDELQAGVRLDLFLCMHESMPCHPRAITG